METLVELMHFMMPVKGDGQSVADALVGRGDTGRMTALIDGVRRKAFADDSRACTALYGSTASMDAYRHLKARLRQRLVEAALLAPRIDRRFSKYEAGKLRAQKALLTAHTLYFLDYRRAAAFLLRYTLRSAMAYHWHDVAERVCLLLCRYAAFTGDRSYVRWTRLHARLKELADAALLSEQLEYTVTSAVINVTGYTPGIRRAVAASYRRLAALRRRHPTNPVVIRYFRMKVRYHHSRWEYDAIVRTCRACQAYQKRNVRFRIPGIADEFRLLEMEASMQSGRFRQAEETLRALRPRMARGTSSWYIVNEYYVLAALRTGNYRKALAIYTETFPKGGVHRRAAIHNERWLILEAYLNVVLPEAAAPTRFRLVRFLNEVPVAGRDKSGYNFSILVVRILLLIQAGRYDDLVGLEEPYRQYLHRHIARRRHPRHHAFGHLLRHLLAGRFRAGAPNRVAARMHRSLASHKGPFGRYEETEVIPYETLWGLVISLWAPHAPGLQSSARV